MKQSNTQLILLQAAIKCQDDLGYFRNMHLVQMTGLEKNAVAHHLKKWERKGFIVRNPTNQVEWILHRKDDLMAELVTEKDHHVEHMKKIKAFNEEWYGTVTQASDIYAALKSLGFATDAALFAKDIEAHIDSAIEELQSERYYLHQRRMTPKVAAKTLKKYKPPVIKGVDSRKVKAKIEEILGSNKELPELLPKAEATEQATEISINDDRRPMTYAEKIAYAEKRKSTDGTMGMLLNGIMTKENHTEWDSTFPWVNSLKEKKD